eukprot:TRINITY_DN1949_c0_g2_i1.p1 TRINITY_DN1949_c0_g2~~TRINITY_DN1949_c0_g2_i1.p1  ORF type:complete len:638 (+),score=97.33 TRINITY_DN1949_c0_g2_i1:184-1914(+)
MESLIQEEPVNSGQNHLIEVNDEENSTSDLQEMQEVSISSPQNTTEQSQEVGEFLSNLRSAREPIYTIETLNTAGANGVTRILRNQRDNPVWRRTIYFEMFWLIVTTFIIVFALFSYEHKMNTGDHVKPIKLHNTTTPTPTPSATETFYTSKQPGHTEPQPPKIHHDIERKCNGEDMRLVHWAFVHVALQVCMLGLMSLNQWLLPKSDTEVITERRMKNIMSMYILSRFSHMLWLVWALLGIIWRRTIYFEMFWLIVTTFIIVFALFSYEHKMNTGDHVKPIKLHNTTTPTPTPSATETFYTSKQPGHTEPQPPKIHHDIERKCNGEDMRLVHWAFVHVALQVCMLGLMSLNQWLLPKSDTEVITERRMKNIMSMYILSRFSHMLWLVWALLGIIWTFEARICKPELGLIFTVSFVISICHLVAFCVPLLFCCCSLPIGFLIWCFCPSYMRRHQIGGKTKKATKRQIKKHTTSMKYKPFDESATSMSSFSIRKEDANCAICLGDYEEDEELRFLSCKHHFHGECVTEWLQHNKVCPMCKKSIDGEEEEKPEAVQRNESDNNNPLHGTIDNTVPFIV